MSLDFDKLVAGTTAKQTDPRKIFTTLKRDSRFKRPLDEQADILDAWHDRRTAQDLTLKMNTGGGKTMVGLLCLQSSLNENISPAVYITPDNYLVNQVQREAEALGIRTTDDEKDPSFISGKAILVVNVWKLFNARSVFGVGQKKIPIGSIVIDDAHACLSVVHEQFSIKAPVGTPVYDDLLSIFERDLEHQSPSGLLDLKAKDPNIVMTVPYWAWQSRQSEVIQLLHKHRDSQQLEWSWPLLKECIPLCNCLLGGKELEISPQFVPIDRINSFATAKRRIYMTATLADDSILVSHFCASAKEVNKPLRPKGGGDIGDRMILAPQEINPDFEVEEIRDLISVISKDVNVVVIVPSRLRANFWKDIACQILDKDNIQEGVDKLKNGVMGLTVLVNKYDGIDLPGKACELLVIDGLPEVYGLHERMEMMLLDGTKRHMIRQVQRIEQGMGRGVRSSDDHCVVLLLGARLTQRLHQPDAEAMFSSSTRAQIQLGKSVAEQIRGKSLDKLREIMTLCLSQDDNWVQAGRNAVVNAPPSDDGHIDDNQVLLREAFDAARTNRHDQAIDKVQLAVNSTDELQLKGYLKQQLAAYINFIDPARAQELQLAALAENPRLLKPLTGTTFRRLSAPPGGQAIAAVEFMRKFLNGNDLTIWVNGLLEILKWGEEDSRRFESGMKDLGLFLGFGSERPEDETGRGPDNLWALGSSKYFVIECKSGAVTAERISKHDTNQLNGSIIWFEKKYGTTCTRTPLMVHPKTVFEGAASPHQDIRIINESSLDKMLEAVKSYAVCLASSGGYTDCSEVQKQLEHYKLSAEKIEGCFTVKQGAK